MLCRGNLKTETPKYRNTERRLKSGRSSGACAVLVSAFQCFRFQRFAIRGGRL